MTQHSEAEIEAEIQAGAPTGPRLTPDHIDSLIVAEHTFRLKDALEALGHPVSPAFETMTLCVLGLRNGFIVVGESACVTKTDFNPEIGRKIARDNARNQIWKLEGYALKSAIHEDRA